MLDDTLTPIKIEQETPKQITKSAPQQKTKRESPKKEKNEAKRTPPALPKKELEEESSEEIYEVRRSSRLQNTR